jgi:hypothetical protein
VDVRCLRALLLLATGALACGQAPDSPGETVKRYFACLGRDPVRSLELLSPAFHASHGLRLGAAVDQAAARDPLAAARVAWLSVQRAGAFQEGARHLAAEIVKVSEEAAAAEVVTRVLPARGTAFVQRFQLSRPDGRWRVDAVAQEQVGPQSRLAAFVAHPTETGRRELAEVLASGAQRRAQRAGGERRRAPARPGHAGRAVTARAASLQRRPLGTARSKRAWAARPAATEKTRVEISR